ncbi:MAG: hypothetical protein WC822_03030 [Candidatus Paceibacterota bacterium]|jgi:hypothetical protein
MNELLKSFNIIKEIIKLSITGSGEKLRLNAEIKAGVLFIKTNIKFDNVCLINKGNNIQLEENYLSKITATKAEDTVKSKMAEHTDSIGEKLKEFIEKEKGKKVQKIWIEDGQLKVEYEKVVNQKIVPPEIQSEIEQDLPTSPEPVAEITQKPMPEILDSVVVTDPKVETKDEKQETLKENEEEEIPKNDENRDDSLPLKISKPISKEDKIKERKEDSQVIKKRFVEKALERRRKRNLLEKNSNNLEKSVKDFSKKQIEKEKKKDEETLKFLALTFRLGKEKTDEIQKAIDEIDNGTETIITEELPDEKAIKENTTELKIEDKWTEKDEETLNNLLEIIENAKKRLLELNAEIQLREFINK